MATGEDNVAKTYFPLKKNVKSLVYSLIPKMPSGIVVPVYELMFRVDKLEFDDSLL